MIIIRERGEREEPFYNARGKCECGCEMELPLEAWLHSCKPLAGLEPC